MRSAEWDVRSAECECPGRLTPDWTLKRAIYGRWIIFIPTAFVLLVFLTVFVGCGLTGDCL